MNKYFATAGFLFVSSALWATPNFPLDIPAKVAGDRSLAKAALTISYSPEHKQAHWVYYELNPGRLRDCVKRSNRFKQDPELSAEETATLADYAAGNYDRGHMSPAGDNRFDREAMNESFLLSNISPQPGEFNSGIWARLELLVRAWALRFGGLIVTTGPVLQNIEHTIGESKVSVPDFYYKVLLTADHKQAIGFLMPTTAKGSIAPFATSIDRIEQITGLNFLSGLGVEEQKNLEQDYHPDEWDFSAKFQYLPCSSSGTSPDSWFSLYQYFSE